MKAPRVFWTLEEVGLVAGHLLRDLPDAYLAQIKRLSDWDVPPDKKWVAAAQLVLPPERRMVLKYKYQIRQVWERKLAASVRKVWSDKDIFASLREIRNDRVICTRRDLPPELRREASREARVEVKVPPIQATSVASITRAKAEALFTAPKPEPKVTKSAVKVTLTLDELEAVVAKQVQSVIGPMLADLRKQLEESILTSVLLLKEDLVPKPVEPQKVVPEAHPEKPAVKQQGARTPVLVVGLLPNQFEQVRRDLGNEVELNILDHGGNFSTRMLRPYSHLNHVFVMTKTTGAPVLQEVRAVFHDRVHFVSGASSMLVSEMRRVLNLS